MILPTSLADSYPVGGLVWIVRTNTREEPCYWTPWGDLRSFSHPNEVRGQ